MKRRKFLATALVLSGSIGFGCNSMNDQGTRSSGAAAQGKSSSAQQKSAGRVPQGDMQKVEQALKVKGYDPGTIDGKADAQTQKALRDYQSKNKLDVTGTIDSMTAESLDIVIVFLPE
jgi:peptidoglycan hydrolase-like protein with peptidoglycan-binding domain